MHAREPLVSPLRHSLPALLLALAAAPVWAASVTAVYGDHGGTLWTATAPAHVTGASTPVIGFTVGGTTYSTGVNDSLLPSGHTPAQFRAFTPMGITNGTGSMLAAMGNAMPAFGMAPTPALTPSVGFITDGPRGLELATALFNAPAQNLNFGIAIAPGTTDFTTPVVLTTQMGQPSTLDVYSFVDAAGSTVGNAVSVSYPATGIGELTWQFFKASDGTPQTSLNGNRAIRLEAYSLGAFGLNAGNMGNVAAFRQVLGGASDVAFVAYNERLLAVRAPELEIDLAGLSTNPLILGQPYTGSYTCKNNGIADANTADTSCVLATLPTGFTQGACTIDTSPAAPWVAGNPIPAGRTITCGVTATMNAMGIATIASSTTGANTTTVGGDSVTTADPNPANNTSTLDLNVLAPDMRVDSVTLPPATVGQPYSGSFVCSNHGTAPATSASCAAPALPAWASVSCDPATPVASLAIGAPITCTVGGTPTNDKGTTPITVTTSADHEPDTPNNTAPGSLTVAGLPHVVIDLTGLPTSGTVGLPYSGQFTCTNNGTANAASALCTAVLAPWMTLGACTISPSGASWASPGDLPEGQTVTCPVTGTPTQPGPDTVTGTGGSTSSTRDVTVSALATAVPTPVPTLAQWGLALMAGMLALLGMAGVRRRVR